jgi:hypothetical protein
MIPANVTGNIAGIGSQGPNDPVKIPDNDRKKYKKRNRLSFKEFVRGIDKLP